MSPKSLLFLLLFSASTLWAQQLHYDRPAQYFEEALPIGNGRMGAMLYGGPITDKISLNDITLWTGEPEHIRYDSAANATALTAIREALFSEDYETAEQLQKQLQGHYSENYQPLGTLFIEYEHADSTVQQYQRWLDIGNAIAGNRFIIGAQQFTTDYFCSHPDQVMVIRIHSDQPFHFRLRLTSKLPHACSAHNDELVSDGYAAYHSLPHYYLADTMFYYDPNRGIHFRTLVKVLGANHIQPEDSTLLVTADHDVILLMANATSFNGFDKDPVKEGRDYQLIVREQMDAAATRSYAQLRKRHIRDYRQYFNRLSLNLGKTADSIRRLPTDEQLRRYTAFNEYNPDLEELYFQYGRYLLISSSRTEGVPATLQGLWNEQILPPWSSNYTCNINLEENYWPAEVADLSEMHQPLLTFLKNVSVNGTRTARDFYGVQKGWCLAHNSDIWAMTNPVGLQSGDPVWANWNMGGTWLSTHIWQHYQSTRNKAFLLEYYPILKGAAEFCMGWLIKKDSLLITAPATSPENKYITDDGFYGATYYGGTADVAMIRECLNDAVLAALELKTDTAFCREARATLQQLPAYRIGQQGNLQEWFHDWADAEPQHRHQSHLFGLYPGHSITAEDTLLANACRRTLELRGDESTGWSTGWRINLYARLLDGEKAYQMYRKLLRYVSPDGYTGADAIRGGGTYPNLMDAHSPFQIDGNFGGCAGVCEMFLQAKQHGRECLPKVWRKAKTKLIE